MTTEELLAEKQKLKKSKFFYATAIGFLTGIFIFGIVSWIISGAKHVGFLIPMAIPVIFIYRIVKNRNNNNDLEAALKARGLS